MTDFALSHWQRLRVQEPPTVRNPQDYDGGPALSIACTQTDLPVAAQKRLVAQWCELLTTLTKVRQLWFRSQVPQRLLDAAARMPALTDLWVKWSSVESLDALGEASSLVHLHLGGAARAVKWLTASAARLQAQSRMFPQQVELDLRKPLLRQPHVVR